MCEKITIRNDVNEIINYLNDETLNDEIDRLIMLHEPNNELYDTIIGRIANFQSFLHKDRIHYTVEPWIPNKERGDMTPKGNIFKFEQPVDIDLVAEPTPYLQESLSVQDVTEIHYYSSGVVEFRSLKTCEKIDCYGETFTHDITASFNHIFLKDLYWQMSLSKQDWSDW